MKKLKHGYVQVYTGDGKGKTTAALGLSLRAVGAGLRVRIIQFMKGQHYSELDALKRLTPEVEVHHTGRKKCIRREEVSEVDQQEARRGLDLAHATLRNADVDLLILDEILVAQWFDLIAVEEILQLIDEKPQQIELVLTGRRAADEIIQRADLVTEMREIKHYYTQGVAARRGIES